MVTGHTRDSRFHWRRLSARGLILTSAAVMLAAAGSAYSHLEKGIPHAHGTDADASTRASDGPELVFSELVPGWLFSHPAELDISLDGRFASLGSGVWFALVDLGSGAALERSDGPRKISAAAFRGKRDLAFFNGKAWFSGRIADASRSTALDLPAPIAARWCANGEQVAYFVSLPYFVENETSGSLWVGNARGVSTKLAVDGRVTAVEWFPKCDALLVLTHDAGTGLSRLSKVDPLSGKAQLLRGELDAAGLTGSVGISADARTAYLSLAGATPPEDRVRHEPHARNRDLDIYALDLASGKLERLVASPYDDFAPVVRGNTLYWTRNHLKTDAVVLPIEGGEPHIVLEGGQLPYWNTEGNMIAATIGQNRIADVVLNLDIDVVTLDANKRPVGPPREILRGSHEDFTAAWSPDGRWMAYHTHRCADNAFVPFYMNPRCADTIGLLRPGESREQERLLTDWTKEVGPAEWAPDSRRLLFSSWDRNEKSYVAYMWIATLDPETGTATHFEKIGVPSPMVNPRLHTWSPVADEIAIEDIVSERKHVFYIYDLRTKTARQVAEAVSFDISGVDWTADGQEIVYSANVGGRHQLFRVSKSGGPSRQISWEMFGNLVLPQVSPDGQWVAATRSVSAREIWRMPLGSP